MQSALVRAHIAIVDFDQTPWIELESRITWIILIKQSKEPPANLVHVHTASMRLLDRAPWIELASGVKWSDLL